MGRLTTEREFGIILIRPKSMKICKKCGALKELYGGKIQCRLCCLKWQRLYYRAPKRLASYREYFRIYMKTRRANDPIFREKHRIRSKVEFEIKRGRLIRGLCEVCNSRDVEAHHDDYNKPLEVRWFCKEHHKQYERNQRAKGAYV